MSQRQCKNGRRCAHFKEKGRPAFLNRADTRAEGVCRRCVGRGIGLRGGHHGVSPVLLGEGILAPETPELIESRPEDVALKFMLDGKDTIVETATERGMRQHYVGEGGALVPGAVGRFMSLERFPMTGNLELKEPIVLETVQPELWRLVADALSEALPSKEGPEPAYAIERELTPGAPWTRSEHLFRLLTQAANLPVNDQPHEADALHVAIPRSTWAALASYDGAEKDPFLSAKSAPGPQDYSAAALLSTADCEQIFGTLSPDQVAVDVAIATEMWAGRNWPTMKSGVSGVAVGEEMLGPDRAAAYAAAVDAGLRALRGEMDAERRPALRVAERLQRWTARRVEEKGFASEKEAVDWMLSNPAELDDFLYDEDAFSWALAESRRVFGEHAIPQREADRVLGTLRAVRAFTDEIDRRWAAAYEKDGVAALSRRFGHPVGIPAAKVAPHHFLSGGYLVEGGWLKPVEGERPGLDLRLPVDAEGRPDASTAAWDEVTPRAVIRRGGSRLEKLGDLAESCVSGAEAWQVAYNRGLPRDSLYNAALLSVIDQNVNAASQDDFSGTVRGLPHPMLRGVNMASGRDAFCFPTTRSRIAAIAARFAGDPRACPRGAMTLKEIDLANWRLARLSDNLCGNEYGVNSVKKGAEGPYNFDKLDRAYHEKIQNEIRVAGANDGLVTYHQPEEEFVRPLLGCQRGEAMRLFVERPGTYLRRAGGCGVRLEGAARAVWDQVTNPLTPTLAFLDPAIGKVTDCSRAARGLPGHRSLHPLLFCASGSGTARLGLTNSSFQGVLFSKQMTVNPGSRGENLPRRLRFAALSLGERATTSGLIDPGVGKDRVRRVANLHAHVEDPALVTDDAPSYAPELERAFWHRPALWAQDYEVGAMGSAWRKVSDAGDETSRRRALQGMLAGKQLSYHALTNDVRATIVIAQNYEIPVDSRVFFGDPKVTADYAGRGDMAHPDKRDQGLLYYGRMTAGMPVATFSSRERFEVERKQDTIVAPKGDDPVAGPEILLAVRGGHVGNGLEDVPVAWCQGRRPSEQGEYVEKWASLVVEKGLAGEFEPSAEWAGVADRGEPHFRDLSEKSGKYTERLWREAGGKGAATTEASRRLGLGLTAFSPPSLKAHVGTEEALEVEAHWVNADERIVRAAGDREDGERRDVRAKAAAFEAEIDRRHAEEVANAYPGARAVLENSVSSTRALLRQRLDGVKKTIEHYRSKRRR